MGYTALLLSPSQVCVWYFLGSTNYMCMSLYRIVGHFGRTYFHGSALSCITEIIYFQDYFSWIWTPTIRIHYTNQHGLNLRGSNFSVLKDDHKTKSRKYVQPYGINFGYHLSVTIIIMDVNFSGGLRVCCPELRAGRICREMSALVGISSSVPSN